MMRFPKITHSAKKKKKFDVWIVIYFIPGWFAFVSLLFIEQYLCRDGNSGSGFGSPVGFAPDRCGFGCIFAAVTWTRPAQNRVWMWVSFFTRGCTQNLKKNSKPERNPKPKKTQNPKETRKNLKRNLKNPKRNPFTKPTGTWTQPKTRRVRVPNFTCGFEFGWQIQRDYIVLVSDIWLSDQEGVYMEVTGATI
jgi:hypothetical protein